MHMLWKIILQTSKAPLPMLIFSSILINVRHYILPENTTKSTTHTSCKIPLWKKLQIAKETLVSWPLLPSLGLNKSSTSAPKQASHLVIFGGLQSRPGLHSMLTSSSVQNAFNDVHRRRSTYRSFVTWNITNASFNIKTATTVLLARVSRRIVPFQITLWYC